MLELAPHPVIAATKRAGLALRHHCLLTLYVVLLVPAVASAQTASLRGQVVDQSGAVIPKASVTLTAPSGLVRKTASIPLEGLPPGPYTVQAAAPKLEQEPVQIVLTPGIQNLRLELKVAAVQQQTSVQENANTSVSTESTNNASALVLRRKDLESLADDPEDHRRGSPGAARAVCRTGRQFRLYRWIQRRSASLQGCDSRNQNQPESFFTGV
jgi:hypothetical protein